MRRKGRSSPRASLPEGQGSWPRTFSRFRVFSVLYLKTEKFKDGGRGREGVGVYLKKVITETGVGRGGGAEEEVQKKKKKRVVWDVPS